MGKTCSAVFPHSLLNLQLAALIVRRSRFQFLSTGGCILTKPRSRALADSYSCCSDSTNTWWKFFFGTLGENSLRNGQELRTLIKNRLFGFHRLRPRHRGRNHSGLERTKCISAVGHLHVSLLQSHLAFNRKTLDLRKGFHIQSCQCERLVAVDFDAELTLIACNMKIVCRA